ncbi:MAG: hypothetical protein IPM91_04640 [Bacteroidetes bacterium]|nr:hypothetical protein [Bacteroidota bacterium]
MSLAKIIVITLFLFPQNLFSQEINRVTDREKESIKGMPSKVVVLEYAEIDMFGEQTEELISTNTKVFNSAGFYISINDDINPQINPRLNPDDFEKYNSQKYFIYYPNSLNIKEIQFRKKEEKYKNSCYNIKYNYLEEKSEEIVENCDGSWSSFQFSIYKRNHYYDKNKNIYKTEYEGKGSGIYKICLMKYNIENRKISEDYYDMRGNLIAIRKFTYDNLGRLIEDYYQDGKDKNSPSVRKSNIKNQFDGKGNLIKTSTESYYSISEENSSIKYYTWFKNIYSIEGNLKRVEEYLHYNSSKPPKDVLQSVTEYLSYDKYNNWTSKIIYKNCYKDDDCNFRYTKFKRQIEYYKSNNDINTFKLVNESPIVETPIGSQIWAKINLEISFFQNGDPIREARTYYEWQTAIKNKEPAWCCYANDSLNGEKFGILYNIYAILDSRRLAPKVGGFQHITT